MSRTAFLQETGIAREAVSVALVCLIIAVLASIPPGLSVVAWSGDPTLNTVICAAQGDQASPVAVGDGYSGTVIAWQDHRNGADWDIYAQRADPTGAVQWPDNGIAVCTASHDQTSSVVVSDGQGGAIVAWQDGRDSNYDIYAQRIDPAGAALWTTGGVPVCIASYDQVSPVVVSDGSAGAIVVWRDRRNGSDYDIYAQKIAASGITQWTANGVAICTAASDQTSVAVIGDTDGGAIIAWQDLRNQNNYDIYAQRVDSSCSTLWTANGVSVCTAAGHQINPVIVQDGAGGAIIAWQDSRSETNYDVYGQRVDSAGTRQWATNGVPICTAVGDQSSLSATSDGSGGVIIAWDDARAATNSDIYGQRLNSTGTMQWTADGVPVSTAPEDQRSPVVVSDGSGGAIIAWQDSRSKSDYDIYSQRVNPSGSAQWPTSGIPVCTAEKDQGSLTAIGDGSSGAIIAWQDSRNPTKDIYAQRVQASGTLSRPPNQPRNLSPADSEQGVSLTPNLRCSVFSPAEPGEAHVASQWRVTTTPGDYGAPVFDSGPDGFSLLQVTLEYGKLTGNATYYWQVRHKSSSGLWSPWSAETSFTSQNRRPDQPAGISPQNGSPGVGLTPTLQCSAFRDPDVGDYHAASQWRITTTLGNYGTPVFWTAEIPSALTQVIVDSGRLTENTTYFWEVRHQDNHGAWSDWSQESSFTTQGTPPVSPPVTTENRPPDRPVCIAPEAGATNVSVMPTLESSAFHDPDDGDCQAASQWQITTASGNYSEPAVELLAGLNSISLRGETLSQGTTYYWRVRYQDSHGAWSEWSDQSSFTTRAEEQGSTANKTNMSSWIYLGAVVAVAVLATAAVAWRNARAATMVPK